MNMNNLSSDGLSYNIRQFFSRLIQPDREPNETPWPTKHIFVENFSRLVKNDEVDRWCSAVRIQINRDLSSVYPQTVSYRLQTAVNVNTYPRVELHDNGGGLLRDDMFGGHVQTGLIVVNVKKCLDQHPGHASMTFSHELLEYCHNHDAHSTIGNKYQDIVYGKFINGVYCSNFEKPDGRPFYA